MSRHRLPWSRLLLPALLALAACKAATPAAASDTAAAAAPPAAAAKIATAAAAINPMSRPEDEVKAAMGKLIAATRYHASLQMQGGPNGAMANELDFVAPDRYRMAMQGLGTQVIIGDTMHMRVGGRKMKLPLPAGTLSQWRDPARLDDHTAGMTVQAQGSDSIDGKPARKYLIRHDLPQPSEVLLWIGNDGLPMQLKTVAGGEGRGHAMTMRYSRFNDPTIEIQPPQ